MTRGIWGDPERYLETYWRRFPGVWTHGDWASIDEDGYWFLHGRSDDTLNIAGKRIGPSELESAAVGHPAVVEAAAVGIPHEVKGEVAWLYCVLAPGGEATEADVAAAVASELGKAFAPDRVIFVSALPKTRSAKIVRRAVRARALGQDPGDSPRSRTRRRSRRSSVPSDSLSGVALVTGGGRGIGASIARELADAGMRVAVTGRTTEQVDAVADEIRGLALVGDVARREDVEAWVARTEKELGPIDLLAANAGSEVRMGLPGRSRSTPGGTCSEVNVLGVHLACRAVIPGMLEREGGRIVITGSGAAYLPGSTHTAYPASKAAVWRYGETLARELSDRIPVFVFSPGLVRTAMTGSFGDDAPWTPPSWRRSSSGCSRPAERMPSRAGTSMPSTTTSRT